MLPVMRRHGKNWGTGGPPHPALSQNEVNLPHLPPPHLPNEEIGLAKESEAEEAKQVYIKLLSMNHKRSADDKLPSSPPLPPMELSRPKPSELSNRVVVEPIVTPPPENKKKDQVERRLWVQYTFSMVISGVCLAEHEGILHFFFFQYKTRIGVWGLFEGILETVCTDTQKKKESPLKVRIRMQRKTGKPWRGFLAFLLTNNNNHINKNKN